MPAYSFVQRALYQRVAVCSLTKIVETSLWQPLSGETGDTSENPLPSMSGGRSRQRIHRAMLAADPESAADGRWLTFCVDLISHRARSKDLVLEPFKKLTYHAMLW